jgi:hypothetical protein
MKFQTYTKCKRPVGKWTPIPRSRPIPLVFPSESDLIPLSCGRLLGANLSATNPDSSTVPDLQRRVSLTGFTSAIQPSSPKPGQLGRVKPQRKTLRK